MSQEKDARWVLVALAALTVMVFLMLSSRYLPRTIRHDLDELERRVERLEDR